MLVNMLIKFKKTMPNHVRNSISVEAEYTDILKKISKTGLLEYIKPMPKSLDVRDVSDSCIKKAKEWKSDDIESQIRNKKLCDFNEKFHGYRTWYKWRIDHWGTKWTDYETEFKEYDSGATYTFTTAWAPPSTEIMMQLAKIIPDLDFIWEEEQGFGEHIIYKDGVIVHHQEWDIPDFLEIEELEDVYYLTEAYNYIGEIFPVGYYAEYDIHSYLGETLAEAKATKKEMKALLGFDKQ
jgi:hypothetical protein